MHIPKAAVVFAALSLAALYLCPSATGQERTRPLPEQVFLQLIGLDGKTVDSEIVYVCYQTKNQYHYEQLRTDSKGSLELVCPGKFQGKTQGTVILQRASWPEDGGEIPTAYLGAKELTFSELAKSWKIQLERPLLLVSGRVVDRQGTALEGVEVSVRADAVGIRLDPRVRRITVMHHHKVTTTADGRFAIHQNKTRVRDLRVKLKMDGYAELPHLRLEVGTTGAALAMAKSETVYGQVSGVPKGKRPFLVFRLSPRDSALKNYEPYFDMKDGNLRFDQVIVGSYDFKLMASSGRNAKALLSIPNITVTAGETCRDPRLAAIDISSLYRWICLRLVDQKGEPLIRTRVKIQTGLNRSALTVNGAMSLWKLIPAKGSEIEIQAAGFRTKTIPAPLASEVTVTLSRGWTLAFAMSDLPVLRVSQVHVKVSNNEHDSSGQVLNRASPLHTLIGSTTRRGSVVISRPGSYTVQILALPQKHPNPVKRPQPLFQRGVRVGEHIILATRSVRILEGQDSSKAIPMLITLTPSEFAVLKSFDIVLEERGQ